jgi:glycosyltransferase involved in cell wall biosynthesis
MDFKVTERNNSMKIQPAIVIPTYNNSRTIADVIAGARKYNLPIYVVNDGSTDDTSSILEKTPYVNLITFPKNRGKGAAFRKAFDDALAKGFTHAITIDADGQHLAEDIATFIQKINEEPDTLWIGERLLQVDGSLKQPPRSRFGRRFGAFWYKFYTGIPIRDTQCGFRVYPLKKIATTGCKRDRFEYEIEVLILAAWRGIPVKSIPIHMLYQPKEERVSHFRPIRDFMRISKVNSRAAITRIFFPTQLLDAPGLSIREKLIALIKHELRAHTSPIKISMSLALGVFMAIFPIHGFQVVTLIALTYIFHLNRPLALVGVSVSSAPLIPFWIAAGIAVGNAVMPSSIAAPMAAAVETKLPEIILNWIAKLPVQGVFEGVIKWFFGSIMLAGMCGVVTFGVSYPLVKRLVVLRRGRKG